MCLLSAIWGTIPLWQQRPALGGECPAAEAGGFLSQFASGSKEITLFFKTVKTAWKRHHTVLEATSKDLGGMLSISSEESNSRAVSLAHLAGAQSMTKKP